MASGNRARAWGGGGRGECVHAPAGRQACAASSPTFGGHPASGACIYKLPEMELINSQAIMPDICEQFMLELEKACADEKPLAYAAGAENAHAS